jgi:hypothetical protein
MHEHQMISTNPTAMRRRSDRVASYLPGGGLIPLMLVGLGLIVGCGRNTGPVVQFVEGKVLLDGQPLEGATVGLSPVKGTQGLPGYARTNAGGIFRVTSTRGGKRDAGAAVGDYVVTISKVVAEEADEAEEDQSRPESVKKQARSAARKQPWNVVPDIYAEVATSPLRASVQSGENVGPAFVFDLKTAGSAATP